MEKESVFAEADDLHAQKALILLLRQRERRLTRTSRCLAATLLLLLLAALVLLALPRGRSDPGSQRMAQHGRQSLDIAEVYASARLTAPDAYSAKVDYLEWQSDIGEAHCHGFNCSSRSLEVPAHVRSGTYRISLQVTYEGFSANCGGPVMILSHTVFVISDVYRDKRPLLSSFDTVSCGTKQWKKTLYTEGLFKLEATSRISVTSWNPGLIVKKEYLTFLSAELQKVHVN